MIYMFLAVALVLVMGIASVTTMANANKAELQLRAKAAELEKKCNTLESMVINLAQTVADMQEKADEQDKKLENIPAYVEGLFNEAANNMSKELSEGVNQVLNFTPYGVK